MKRNLTKSLAVASLCVVSTFSMRAQAFKEHYGIHRGGHYEKRTRENKQDAAHRDGIKAAINQLNAELALIRPRYEAVKQEYKAVEAKLQGTTAALEKFRNDRASDVKASVQRRAQIEQSNGALARSKSLGDLVEKLVSLSNDDFMTGLSVELRAIDLNAELEVPATSPDYAQDEDSSQLYRAFYEALDADLKQWKGLGLPIERVVDVSLTLRTFSALQKNSAVDLGLVQRDIAEQNRQLETKLAALKASLDLSRAIDAELLSVETNQRSALVEFDRAAAILRVSDEELKRKEGDLAARQKELSEFKVRIEKYQVWVESDFLN